MTRYEVPNDEDYQPGSTTVLKNYLNTCDPVIIEQEETKALKLIHQDMFQNLKEHDKITNKLILKMHEKWLGKIYPFAGKYRTVLMSKDGFTFAAPCSYPNRPPNA
jgi:cell filamentation protein